MAAYSSASCETVGAELHRPVYWISLSGDDQPEMWFVADIRSETAGALRAGALVCVDRVFLTGRAALGEIARVTEETEGQPYLLVLDRFRA